MHPMTRLFSRPLRTVLLIDAVLAVTCVLAAAPKVETPAAALHRQERAVCLGDRSNQDRATCLREADAAFAEARRGGLAVDALPFSDNARRRCDPLPEVQRQACHARMQGQGSTSGSAATGGIYRELTTLETDVPAK